MIADKESGIFEAEASISFAAAQLASGKQALDEKNFARARADFASAAALYERHAVEPGTARAWVKTLRLLGCVTAAEAVATPEASHQAVFDRFFDELALAQKKSHEALQDFQLDLSPDELSEWQQELEEGFDFMSKMLCAFTQFDSDRALARSSVEYLIAEQLRDI